MATARFALVGAVVAGLVFTLVLATSPRLHQSVHPDSDQPAHSCLVTTLQACGYEAVLVVQLAAASVTSVSLRGVGKIESFFLSCRLLEHGPPRVLLS
ncbi:MAG: hypothetical protein H6Q34_1147 [Deltaproteobacteria bacterium]|nr:hypothetical protein [Deltaproteobacteria bacterium]